jgi:hypothetical protein
MARTGPNRSGAGVRAAIIGVGVVALIAIIAFQVVGSTRNLEIGQLAETDLGDVAVRGWETGDEETAVSVYACPGDTGATIDLSALRVSTADVEIEPSGSRMAPAGDPGCVDGSVVFATTDAVEQVVYLASPRVVWREPAP